MTNIKKTASTLLTLVLILSILALPAQAAVIDDVRDIIQDNYVDEISEEMLQESTVEEILTQLNDPYASYFTAEQYQEFLSSIGDITFSGIGVQMESVPSGMLVIKTLVNSTAGAANIKAGDIITNVNGFNLAGLAIEHALPLIRGPEGSVVNLTINRAGATYSISILRKKITLPSVESESISGNIGYIDINSFGLETPEEFRHALDKLKAAGAGSYIIDLRNNGGGYLSAALNIAGYFIGNDTALQTKIRSNPNRYRRAVAHDYIIDKPVVFLVNEYSASAAEILAAAVNDNQKALLIGTKTFGKGSVQTIYNLTDKSAIKFTTARFFTPLGNTIEKQGIAPHLTIANSDPLKIAQLLLGCSSSVGNTQTLTLKIGYSDYTIDTRTACTPEYWSAYKELISKLPDYALYKVGNDFDWRVASRDQLDNLYSFYFPAYNELTSLQDVPVDKEFSITSSGYVNKNIVNNSTVELINTDTGVKIPLYFQFLGSSQIIITPQDNLEPGMIYWLVIHPQANLSGQEEPIKGSIAIIGVGKAGSQKSLIISAIPNIAA